MKNIYGLIITMKAIPATRLMMTLKANQTDVPTAGPATIQQLKLLPQPLMQLQEQHYLL